MHSWIFLVGIVFSLYSGVSISVAQPVISKESKQDYEARMKWWKDARFGMFIHWGLYSIPAGEWKNETNHAEWIRTSAEIPLEEYNTFAEKFNPIKFNAEEWVNAASDAGMKYIVITTKHHDGFCLFDSKYTDFDIMATPFHRDILKELSVACKKKNIKLCFYYSIMDWHHPDYLPGRSWEKSRSSDNADFERYVEYMKNQLGELLTNYGDIGAIWFDGNVEKTWNNERGKDLYSYVRSLQPNIIVNDRAGQFASYAFTEEYFVGDFRTPEQFIPSSSLQKNFWETCMTMNDHWGYNSHDNQWKSTKQLVRNLADIASKGGNFLLNVGPTAEGAFPDAGKERLKEIGKWMGSNGEAIYGTNGSPFKTLQWGRCTQKALPGGTRLYLHVFNYPMSGKLELPGIANVPKQAFLLSDSTESALNISRNEDALVVDVPSQSPDTLNAVFVLDIEGMPDVAEAPKIFSTYNIFIDTITVSISSGEYHGEVHYTLDGSIPTMKSGIVNNAIRLNSTTTVSARWFRDGKPLSQTSSMAVRKVVPRPAVILDNMRGGIQYKYFEGDWDRLPDFSTIVPVKDGTLSNFDLSPHVQKDNFGFEFSGYVKIDRDAVYSFFTSSDDGSRLYIDDTLVVDNDQLHPMQEEEGVIALSAGYHSIRVAFFEKGGDEGLSVSFKSTEEGKRVVPDGILFYNRK